MATDRTPRTRGKSLAEIWGQSLKSRREGLGLTRDQLAAVVELTPQAIWLFETGKRVPLDRTKIALARALGTTPEALFPWPPMADLVEGDAA